ncbi:MAG: cytochrome c oxidase subunit II [Leptospiraceae bacterium]|nr:cytochrome c oxidase subunit II [Leptospiraceae bacterium]
MPVQGTKTAGDVDDLYTFLVISSLISFILVMGGIVYFLVKYKRKTNDDRVSQISHNSMLEFLWSFIPFVIFMFVFWWGMVIYNDMRDFPEDTEEIQVIGSQWQWLIKYKNGITITTKDPDKGAKFQETSFPNGTVYKRQLETPIMVVPINKHVKIVMTAKDVLHSFFIPAFRIKQDAVPGKYSYVAFKSNKLGDYQVFCTEYCGLEHSNMPALIRVVSLADYEKWLADNKPKAGSGGLAEKGSELYKNAGCIACHSIDGKAIVGPSWKGLYGAKREFEAGAAITADENYIKESILNSQAKIVKGYAGRNMPNYAGQLEDEDINALIDYIKTLKGDGK